MKKKGFNVVVLSSLLSVLVIGVQKVYGEELKGESNIDFSITDAITDPTDPTNPIDPDSGKLLLKNVPSFSFGIIEAKDIYSGFENKEGTVNGNLIVKDNRLGNDGWTLSAQMDTFKYNNSKLNGATIKLDAKAKGAQEASNFSKVINDKNELVKLTTNGNLRGTFDFNIPKETVKLTLAPNPVAVLEKGNKFETQIVWTLSPKSPEVKSAE